MVKTIEEIFGSEPDIVPKFNESIIRRNQDHTLGLFDAEDDSLVLFFDDSAKHGIYVPMAGGYHVIVHPETHEVVGIYVEGWVEDYVNQIPVLQTMWTDAMKPARKGAKNTKPVIKEETPNSFWAALFAFLLTFVLVPTSGGEAGHATLVGAV